MYFIKRQEHFRKFWKAHLINIFIFFCILGGKKTFTLTQPVQLLFSPEHHEVLHHFFAQVVINSVDLFLSKEG